MMTSQELREKFEQSGKTSREFIDWCRDLTGVVFTYSELSDWQSGKRVRRLTKAPTALFLLFFEQKQSNMKKWKIKAITLIKLLEFFNILEMNEDTDPAEYEDQMEDDWKSALLTEIVNQN